jgi:hypothetical protein
MLNWLRTLYWLRCARAIVAIVCASAVLLIASQPSETAAPALPARVDGYITKYVKLTPAQQSQLAAGQPVTKLLDSDPSKEVAVFGAIWVAAPIASYVAAVKDIERLESGGGFRVTKKISSPPRLEDFGQMTVPDDDAADLKTCKVGECEIKLGAPAIERVRREVDWSKRDARARLDQIVRALALEYVKGYLEGGNAELAIYRDSNRPTFVAKEFESMIERLPELVEFLPDIRRYLLDFPKATLPDSDAFLYWQEAQFGLKPTIRINHLVIAELPNGAAIASKMIYASHYFWTALELRVLVPDPARGTGFWFVTVNRSRSDGLSGFVGRIIRGKVRTEAEKGMAAVLAATRSMTERK